MGTGGGSLMVGDLNKELFEKYLGERFQVTGEEGAKAELVLSRVRDCAPHQDTKGAPKIESFSVIFDGAPESALGQGTYTFAHPKMGKVEGVFMVPIVGAAPGKHDYEVLFSRIVGNPAEE
jgi:hypothetical protein